MVTPLFLDLDQIIRLHGELIARYGGIDGTRDIGLLHSAIAMPQASYGGCASRARENGPTPAIRSRVPPAALQGHRPCRSTGSRTRNRPATSAGVSMVGGVGRVQKVCAARRCCPQPDGHPERDSPRPPVSCRHASRPGRRHHAIPPNHLKRSRFSGRESTQSGVL